MAIDNKVAALLGASAEAYERAEPNTGEGLSGDWPPEGDHDCFLLSVEEAPSKFKEKGGLEHDCMEIRFTFEVIKDPNSPDFKADAPPQIFRGERFLLCPPSTTFQGEGSKTRNRIGWDRFKGHLSRVLKKDPRECVNPKADYEAVKALLAPGAPRVAVKVRASYRTDGTKTYKTDYILDRLA